MNGLNNVGVDVPRMNWESLGWLILVAGVFAAVFSFWSKTPLPDIETSTVTLTTTKPSHPNNPDTDKDS